MRKLLLTTILAAAPLVSAPAFAGTFSATYSVTGISSTSDPTVDSNSSTGWSISSPVLGQTYQRAFMTLDPRSFVNNYCGTGSDCSSGILTDAITAHITFTDPAGNTVTIAPTATFLADYDVGVTACAVGDGNSVSHKSDCWIWTGAGSTSTDNSPTLLKTAVANYSFGSDGFSIAVQLQNAIDWNLTPQILVTLTDAPAPEPASLALLGVGVLGLGLIRRKAA